MLIPSPDDGPILCHKNHGKCNANATKLSHVFKKTDPILLVPVAILPVLATVGESPWISSPIGEDWPALESLNGSDPGIQQPANPICSNALLEGSPMKTSSHRKVQQIDPPIPAEKTCLRRR